MAEIFVDYKNKFLLYGDFITSLQKSQQTLDALCSKNEAVREDVSRCEQVGGYFDKIHFLNDSCYVVGYRKWLVEPIW